MRSHRANASPGPAARARRIAAATVSLAVMVLAVATLLPVSRASAAQAPVPLGTAGSFAVLAGSGITNTGPTTITGDVGTFPTPSETGFNTVTLTGTNHDGDAVTQQAKSDLVTGYNVAAGRGPATPVATELGGRTLTPGVYSGATLGITGTLTLDALGDPQAVFIFQAGSTLITATGSAVSVVNGATACNVFWQISSSATLGTGSRMVGSILALTSITATTGATIQGRLLARNGSVTLDTNTITNDGYTGGTTTTTIADTTTTAPGNTTTTAPGNTTTTAAGGTTTTAPGNTTTTAAGGTTTSVQAGSTTTVFGATTSVPGGATTTTPGLDTQTTGGSTSTTVRLAFTGFDNRLPLFGTLTLAFGTVLLGLSSARRRRQSRA